MAILKHLIVHLLWQVLQVILLNSILNSCDRWVACTVEWDIVGGSLGVRYMQSLDLAHMAWYAAIMAFNLHNH